MPDILLGCGRSRKRRFAIDGRSFWSGLVTVDMNPDLKPDIVHDLSVLPLPFEDNYADEIHAYDVMEHIGRQGDWRFFFDQWSDIWRVLKPGGYFVGVSPHHSSAWAWGDPGHTRIIGHEQLTYLNQPAYEQVGASPMTDYRFVYKADFDLVLCERMGGQFVYALRAVKPARL